MGICEVRRTTENIRNVGRVLIVRPLLKICNRVDVLKENQLCRCFLHLKNINCECSLGLLHVTRFIMKSNEITKEHTYIHHTQGMLYLSILFLILLFLYFIITFVFHLEIPFVFKVTIGV